MSASSAHWAIEVYARMLRGEGPARLVLLMERAASACNGMLVALCETDEWELENIVVAPDQRRKGIGRALMEELIAEAKKKHASAILLEVRASNSAAQKLYLECGFSIIANRKSYYSNPLEDALVMMKKIGNPTLEIS